jgi:hypothetical protein
MSQENNWLDRIIQSTADKLGEFVAIMCTKDFWAIVAICVTMGGFLTAALIILTNFDIWRMRNCFYASNMNTYLMFNTFLFFVFGGMLALGEVFNYFDNRKRGIPHKRGSIFWFVIITSTLGTVELMMLKESCF